jgi:DamX protein
MRYPRFIRTLCTLVPMSFLLVACAHNGAIGADGTSAASAKAGNFSNTTACTSNPFLQKYGCALDRVEAAAEQNEPDAEYALGYMYYYGIGTVRDEQTAILWIQRAAGQGQSLAMSAMKVIRTTQYPKMGSAKVVSAPKKRTRTKQQASPMKSSATTKASKPAQVTLPATKVVPQKTTMSPQQPSYSKQSMLSAVKNHYTIQLMASHDLSVVKAFIKQSSLGKKVGYYHTNFQHENWYVVIYGDFSSVQDAKLAMAKLPLSLQRAHPWVKSYRTVQKEILDRHVNV